ncbi:YitT family protein [Metabacillus halosaccharovorans]|uniref:YitT family protein n=1 Tax=Metabacillus halosaccharovorans TaxID=930124 RepID=UPI00403DE0CF
MDFIKKLSFVLIGLILTSLGIKILSDHHLTFGGTAGISTIFSFLSPLSWGTLFFIVNLPFFRINRGIVLFVCDSMIILLALALVGWLSALFSILCIFIASNIIGRYKKSPIKEMDQENTINSHV